jgi:F-type H+-transporting ATPase subunit delta
MIANEAARKYALALFQSAEHKGKMDVVYRQIGELSQIIEADSTLLNFLNSPAVLDEHKRELIQTVFATRVERLVVEFLLLLVNWHRINFLPEIIDEFIRLVEAAQGVARITVTTALPLQETERQNLIARMAKRTGMKIVIEEKLAPEIIGGMIIQLYNDIIDGSVRRGLDVMEEQLGKVKVG